MIDKVVGLAVAYARIIGIRMLHEATTSQSAIRLSSKAFLVFNRLRDIRRIILPAQAKNDCGDAIEKEAAIDAGDGKYQNEHLDSELKTGSAVW